MYTTIRIYKGANDLSKELTQRGSEIEKLITAVPGFKAYQLIHTHDGVASVTVCDDRAGCEKSNQVASDFIRQNFSSLKGTTPEVFSGDVSHTFGSMPTPVGANR